MEHNQNKEKISGKKINTGTKEKRFGKKNDTESEIRYLFIIGK